MVEDEKVIKTGIVWKRKGLFTKKRQLFLTDSPRLFYIEIEKKELKGQIPWSVQMEITLRNNTHFDVVTVFSLLSLTVAWKNLSSGNGIIPIDKGMG